ncbi:MAG: heavy metal-associated domain-containing protein [bacterium]|nr:heavy metal-associated domain-containing protein [bacterium]
MPVTKFRITNLSCGACVKLSVGALEKISGVTSASVDLATGSAELMADRDVSWDEITGALKEVNKEAVEIN